MSFILVYTLILLVPLTLAVALRYLIVVPRRECLQCDREVAVTALKCRHCGYRYTFEDREVMKLQAEARLGAKPSGADGPGRRRSFSS